ncbi:MAG TPA: DUF1573 domain-containing protein [Chitinophagales bacterium]|nr:DUF1573 domain-containing protein [Chitinophagales bacterium]
MKKFTLALTFVFVSGAAVFAQTTTTPSSSTPATSTPAVNPNAGEFSWVEETHDFGTIPQGIPVKNKFEFTNVGKEPIIISTVVKTCGCTALDWTKEPVMPGQKGYVLAEFNAAKEGPFTKAITVQSDSKTPTMKLIFKGTVQKSEQAGSVPEQQNIFNQGGN